MATQLAEMPVGLGGGEVAEQDTEAQSAPQERDLEAEARELGWKPKEEWDGRGEWRDADAFIQFRENNLGLKKKEVDHLKREMETLKKTIRRLTVAEQRAYENARADLEREREQAVEAGDIAAFRDVQKRVDKLDSDVRSDLPSQIGSPSKAEVEDAYDAFRDKHSWYDRGGLGSATEVEVEARIEADKLADRYSRQGLQDQMSPADFFEKIGNEVREKFPALGLKATRQKPASDVAAVTNNRAPRGAKTAANLPPDARRQAERFYHQGTIKAKDLNEALEKYAKDFDWS